MELTGEQLIDAPRAKVWAGLMDTEILRAAIPGCETVTDEGDGAYSAVVVASIGPLRARFKGKLQQQDMAPPEQYGLRFEGEGGIAGFAKGTALVTLAEVGENKTKLSYKAEAQIGGRLAQIGSRLVDAAAARMSSQFFGRFQELLNNPGAAQRREGEGGGAAAAGGAANAPAYEGGDGRLMAAPDTRGQFVVQMPAWAWAVTVTVFAGLAAWLGTH